MAYKYGNNVTKTTQRQPIFGKEKEMMQNDAGGYVFKVSPVQRLKRFLILGSESGTFYVSNQRLGKENVQSMIDMIKNNGKEFVQTISEYTLNAPKNSPSIYALVLALTYGDSETKKLGYDLINKVCRTSSHMFEFIGYIQEMKTQGLRGWSRGLRNGVSKFYDKPYDKLAYQICKYRQREGMTHKDVLRLCHATSEDARVKNMFSWVVGKVEVPEDEYILDFLTVLHTTSIKEATKLIEKRKFTWEMVNTELLKNSDIWMSLLPHMPIHAMTRNLGRMASIGMLKEFSDGTKEVVKKLTNVEEIKKSKVSPFQIVLAHSVYNNRHGFKGSLEWDTNSQIAEALSDAYVASFTNVTKTGKNILIGIDSSGSMCGSTIQGTVIDALYGAVAMSQITKKTEPNTQTVIFDTKYMADTYVTRGSGLAIQEAVNYYRKNLGGGTDCSLPIVYALEKQIPNIDTFIIYTDNETWAGGSHAYTEFKKYQRKYNNNARIVNVAMTATRGSIIPENENNFLEVIGFDASTPEIITKFINGEF